ncbi:hypothetical protein [Vibrio phage RYC]|nr:hypothetical protein [Vibrio phage RYC]
MKNALIANIRESLEKAFGNELLGCDFTTQREIFRGTLTFLKDDANLLPQVTDGHLDDFKKLLEIASTIIAACATDLDDFSDFEFQSFLEKLWENLDIEDDFNVETPCGEFRIIDEDAIDQIWTDSLIDLIKDCHEGLHDLPDFVEIDWEKTAENCKVDGKGHHFSSYDGEEHSAQGFYIFRTN